MPTEGLALGGARKFRLRFLTGLLLFWFAVFHVSAYVNLMEVCDCQTFRIEHFNSDAVRLAIYVGLGVLYLAAWIDVVRMLYVRWWPHWGTLDYGADPAEAARTSFPRHIQISSALAVAVGWTIWTCEVFASGRSEVYGGLAGAFAGAGGAVVTQYGAWFLRVSEPFLPVHPTEDP